LVLSPTGSINLGFILREDLLLCLSYLPLGVPNWAVIYTPSEARTKLLETDAKTKLLEAEAMLMAEENKIMLTDLETISDPGRWEWFENKQKMIRALQD
jgi:hypothetical protein